MIGVKSETKSNQKAQYWLNRVDKNPEKFGTTKTHINEVNKQVKKALIKQEQNIKSGERHFEKTEKENKQKPRKIPEQPKPNPQLLVETPVTTSKFTKGLMVRVKGRIGIITQINGDSVTVQYHTGNTQDFLIHYVSICRDQEKLKAQFEESKKTVK
jgi:hypothetical protein